MVELSALVGVLLSVAVTFFGLCEGKYRIEQYGVSPSGRKVIYLAQGGGEDGRQWRIMLREYSEDMGSWQEREVCSGRVEMQYESGDGRERRVLRGDWIDYARNFWWLDEDRVLFWMEWTEQQKDKRGLILYDGKELRAVVLGGGSFFTVYGDKVSRRGPWSVFELTEDGRAVNYQELRGVSRAGRTAIDQVIVGNRVYFTVGTECVPPCEGIYPNMLCSYNLADGSIDTVTTLSGVLSDIHQPGLAIYELFSTQCTGRWEQYKEFVNTAVPWQKCESVLIGLPELLVIDADGNKYWLKSPELSSGDELGCKTVYASTCVISPDCSSIFVHLGKGDEHECLEKLYIVNYRKNEWREVKKPHPDLWTPIAWRENGIWWCTTNEPRSIALVEGFEEVR